MNTAAIAGLNAAATSSGTDSQAAGKTNAANDSLADKGAFLQLLIAQIKNQDPLNPADGVEFLTQLAQFSQLEQLMGIRSDIQALQNTVAANNGPGEGTAAQSQPRA